MYCTIYPTSVPDPYPWSFNPGMKFRKGVYFTGGKNKGDGKDIREWRKGRHQDWGECEGWDLGVKSSSGMWLRSGVRWGSGRKTPGIPTVSDEPHPNVLLCYQSLWISWFWIFNTCAGITNPEIHLCRQAQVTLC